MRKTVNLEEDMLAVGINVCRLARDRFPACDRECDLASPNFNSRQTPIVARWHFQANEVRYQVEKL